MFDEVRDYDKLKEAWVGWRDASGKKMKDLFTEFVELQNSAATAAGKLRKCFWCFDTFYGASP